MKARETSETIVERIGDVLEQQVRTLEIIAMVVHVSCPG